MRYTQQQQPELFYAENIIITPTTSFSFYYVLLTKNTKLKVQTTTFNYANYARFKDRPRFDNHFARRPRLRALDRCTPRSPRRDSRPLRRS